MRGSLHVNRTVHSQRGRNDTFNVIMTSNDTDPLSIIMQRRVQNNMGKLILYDIFYTLDLLRYVCVVFRTGLSSLLWLYCTHKLVTLRT